MNIKWKYSIGQRIIDYNNDGTIKRDLVIIDRKSEIKKKTDKRKENGYTMCTYKYYKYKCNLCGFSCGEYYRKNIKHSELWIEESKLSSRKDGCSCCSGHKIIVKGINDTNTINPNLSMFIDDKDSKLSKSSHKYISVKCPKCGYTKNIIMSNLTKNGFNCPCCDDGVSYPNKFMFNLLKKLDIKFINEYSPEWIKPKRYDFYIPSMNLIIEMDGAFHYIDNYMNGQTKDLSKEIDDYKDKLAIEHGLKVIRIDCNYSNNNRFEYIKNNTINQLKNIFNLNNINWTMMDKNACDSLVFKVAELKNRNPNLYNNEIGILIGGYSTTSVKHLLNKCKELKLVKL